MSQHLETIGAFIDGERVDADALRAALAVEEGRAYLVELAAIREIVATPVTVAGSTVRSPVWSTRSLFAAAAVVAIVGAAGFSLGTLRASKEAAATVGVAPEPTKILKLEAGTTWNEDRSTKGGE